MANPMSPKLADRLRYGLVGVIFVFGLAILVMVANPLVPAEFRAFFIDRSSDCMAIPVSGEIALNQPMSFQHSKSGDASRSLRVCGWIEPQDTGTWSTGPESRLLLDLESLVGDALLDFEIAGFVTEKFPQQEAIVSSGGVELAHWSFTKTEAIHQTLRVPHALANAKGGLALSFTFANATSPAASGINNDQRRLAIRLLSLLVTDEGAAAPP